MEILLQVDLLETVLPMRKIVVFWGRKQSSGQSRWSPWFYIRTRLNMVATLMNESELILKYMLNRRFKMNTITSCDRGENYGGNQETRGRA